MNHYHKYRTVLYICHLSIPQIRYRFKPIKQLKPKCFKIFDIFNIIAFLMPFLFVSWIYCISCDCLHFSYMFRLIFLGCHMSQAWHDARKSLNEIKNKCNTCMFKILLFKIIPLLKIRCVLSRVFFQKFYIFS